MVKPPTVSEYKQIRKYGSVEMAKAVKKSEQIQAQVNKTNEILDEKVYVEKSEDVPNWSALLEYAKNNRDLSWSYIRGLRRRWSYQSSSHKRRKMNEWKALNANLVGKRTWKEERKFANPIEEYKYKYENIIPAGQKKYYSTPEQYRTAYNEQKTKTIDANKILIDQQIKEYQQKIKEKEQRYRERRRRGKERGYSDERLRRYKDSFDEFEAEYQGRIKALEKSYNVFADFGNIMSYARDYGNYEERREEGKNRQKKIELENEAKLKDLESEGYEIGFMKGSKDGKPTTQSMYAYNPETGDWKSYKDLGQKQYDVSKTGFYGGIQVGDTTWKATPKTQLPKTEKAPKSVPVDTGIMEVDMSKIDLPQQGLNQPMGTKMDEPFMGPTRSEIFIAREKEKDILKEEIKILKDTPDWETGSVPTYDYGQGTPVVESFDIPVDPKVFTSDKKPGKAPAVWGLDTTPKPGEPAAITRVPDQPTVYTPTTTPTPSEGKIKYKQPGVTETPTLNFIGDMIDVEIEKKEKRLKDIDVDYLGSPTVPELAALGDQRSSVQTWFGVGKGPTLSGAEVTYGIGKVLGENIQAEFEKDLVPELKKKEQEEIAKINFDEYQARVNAGEDPDKVQKELDAAYAAANKEIEKFASDYQSQWEKGRGAKLQTSAEKVYFAYKKLGEAKDTEAQVGAIFGAGVGAGVVTSGVARTGQFLAPKTTAAVSKVGSWVVAPLYAWKWGTAIGEGEDVYKEAREKGFTKREAIEFGLVGGATDIAPFAFGVAGITTGGLVGGYAITRAQKPILTQKKVTTGVKEGTAYDTITYKSEVIGPKGQKIPVVRTAPQMKTQYSVPGTRVETTTAWRNFLNTKAGMNIKPISQGYPSQTAQQARAIRLLKVYGASEAEAAAAVQFRQPYVYQQTVTGGYTFGDNRAAVGRTFTKLETRDMWINKELGVRTGVKPTRYQQTTFARTADPKALVPGKYTEAARTVTYIKGGKTVFTEAPKISKGYYGSGGRGEFDMFGQRLQYQYSDVVGVTKQAGIPGTYPRAAGGIYIRGGQPIPKPAGVQYTGGPKTPFSKTFPPVTDADDAAAQILSSSISKPTITPSTSKGAPGITISRAPAQPAPSQYAGQGQYELTQVMAGGPKQIGALAKLSPPVPKVGYAPAAAYAPGFVVAPGLTQVLGPTLALSLVQAPEKELEREGELERIGLYDEVTYDRNYVEAYRTADKIQQDQTIKISQAVAQPQTTTPISTTQPITITQPVAPSVIDTPEVVRGRIVPPPPIFTFGLPQKKKKKKAEEETAPYHAEVKVGNKFVKVTDKPHTKSGARDVMARIIDNTTAAQGRLVPAKFKKGEEKKLQRGDDYYARTKDKYRDFNIVKGQRVNRKNVLIEKRNRRSDTWGEKAGLGVAQVRSTGKKGRPRRPRNNSVFRL